MSKISELSDGGSLQSTDYLIAVRSGGNVKVQADGNLSLGALTLTGLTVDTNTLHVDATNNRVGIGTTSPAAQAHLAGAANGTLRVDTTASGYLDLSMYTNGAFIGTSASQPVRFGVNGGEVARLDASGNLLVGTTTNDPADNNDASGIELQAAGQIQASATSARVIAVNRKSTDGEIINLRKDGATVGSIGASGGDLLVGTGDTAVRFVDADDALVPFNTSGSGRDAAIDLGKSAERFKDLYLSGGVYLGGTGAANLLDDYETGTFTATLKVGADTKGTTTAASYVKVGDMVYITLDFAATTISAVGASTGSVTISGLPFTSGGQGRQPLPAPYSLGAVFTNNLNHILPNVGVATTAIGFHDISGTTASAIDESTFTTSNVVASYFRVAGSYAAA